MKLTSYLILATLIAILESGCTNSAIYNGSSHSYHLEEVEANQRYIIEEPLGIQRSHSSAGRFNAQLIFMADQVERNIDQKDLNNTFIVTSFTNLNKLSETTAFGRLVAENLMHELQVRKWKVFEVRMTNNLVINEAGEFSLSRNIDKIKDQFNVGGIITGTYSVSDNYVIVNSRVLDINTGLVMSSGQAFFPITCFTETLLYNEDNLKPMKIIGDSLPSPKNYPEGSKK